MTRCSNFFPLMTCFLFTSLSPFTMELMAPSISSIPFSTNSSLVEDSFSVYFGVLSIVHLVHGYAVSKVGAVGICLYGSLMYGSGSMVLASHDVNGIYFHFSRSLQAIGASACSVSGFCMIRSYLNPKIHLPLINLLRSATLVVAPMVGQSLVDLYGWHAPFTLMTFVPMIGLITLSLTKHVGDESKTNLNRQSKNEKQLILWILGDSLGFSSLLVWVCYAPFIVKDTSSAFGFLYGLSFVGSMFGPFLTYIFTNPKRVCVTSSSLATLFTLFLFQRHVSLIYIGMTIVNLFRSCSNTHAQSKILSHTLFGLSSGIMHSSRMMITFLISILLTYGIDSRLVMLVSSLLSTSFFMVLFFI